MPAFLRVIGAVTMVALVGCVSGESVSSARVRVHALEGAGVIYVDALPREGARDLSLELAAGTHVIELRRENLVLASTMIVVRSGDHVEVDLDRHAIGAWAGDAAVPGELEIRTDPSAAEALVDGSHEGLTPVRVTVAPGVHQVALRAAGYRAHEEEVLVAPGSRATLEVTLSH
jgi:hypothetical protein